MVSIWLCVLLVAIPYDHIMYVGLFGHSAVAFHVFKNVFSCFFMFYWLFVWLCSFQWHFIDLFSCIAASLFKKLNLLTYGDCRSSWNPLYSYKPLKSEETRNQLALWLAVKNVENGVVQGYYGILKVMGNATASLSYS